MDNISQKYRSKSYKTPGIDEYNELLEMLDTGMNDYEIAEELGISDIEVAKLKREYYKDI